MQEITLTEALYVPLGQYIQSATLRKDITGQLKGPIPLFWNMRADSSLVANTPGCPDSLGWLDGSSETQADGH